MIGQTNAFLVKVERSGGTDDSGFTEDYDRPATDPEAGDVGDKGDDLWRGRVAAYWIERRQRVIAGNSTDKVVERTLLIDLNRPQIPWAEDDFVHVEHNGAVKTGRVLLIERRAMPGIPSTVRLTLENA